MKKPYQTIRIASYSHGPMTFRLRQIGGVPNMKGTPDLLGGRGSLLTRHFCMARGGKRI